MFTLTWIICRKVVSGSFVRYRYYSRSCISFINNSTKSVLNFSSLQQIYSLQINNNSDSLLKKLLEFYHKYTYKAWSEIAFYNGCMMALLKFDKIIQNNVSNLYNLQIYHFSVVNLIIHTLYQVAREPTTERLFKSSRSWQNLFLLQAHTLTKNILQYHVLFIVPGCLFTWKLNKIRPTRGKY